MSSRQSLIARMAAGDHVDFLFFWGHTPSNKDGGVGGAADQSCLSQWFPASFIVDGVTYKTAEHFMMAEKARLFADDAVLKRIVESATPADAKALGREVKNYDDVKWGETRSQSVIKGNVAKFTQNKAMGAFLESTGARVLVEAAPRDRIWGIGMGASNPDARDPKKWRGQNLLGFALMETRKILFSHKQ